MGVTFPRMMAKAVSRLPNPPKLPLLLPLLPLPPDDVFFKVKKGKGKGKGKEERIQRKPPLFF